MYLALVSPTGFLKNPIIIILHPRYALEANATIYKHRQVFTPLIFQTPSSIFSLSFLCAPVRSLSVCLSVTQTLKPCKTDDSDVFPHSQYLSRQYLSFSFSHSFIYVLMYYFIYSKPFIHRKVHSFILNQRGTHIGHDLTRNFTLPCRSVGR